MVGCTILIIQALLERIPAYVMQCAHLPGEVLDGLDKVNRNFLWGTSKAAIKIHWVRWHKVTKPKDEGGLGLKTAKGRNVAKLNWRLCTEKDAPWAQVLRSKFYTSRRGNSINANRLPCSRIWTAIQKGREVLTKGSMWMIGRDSKLNFWYSNRTKKGPLQQLIQGPLTQEASMLEVKDVR